MNLYLPVSSAVLAPSPLPLSASAESLNAVKTKHKAVQKKVVAASVTAFFFSFLFFEKPSLQFRSVSDSPLLFDLPGSLLRSRLPLPGLPLVHLPPLPLQRLSVLLGSFDLLPSANLFIPLDNHSRLTISYHPVCIIFPVSRTFFFNAPWPTLKQHSMIWPENSIHWNWVSPWCNKLAVFTIAKGWFPAQTLWILEASFLERHVQSETSAYVAMHGTIKLNYRHMKILGTNRKWNLRLAPEVILVGVLNFLHGVDFAIHGTLPHERSDVDTQEQKDAQVSQHRLLSIARTCPEFTAQAFSCESLLSQPTLMK